MEKKKQRSTFWNLTEEQIQKLAEVYGFTHPLVYHEEENHLSLRQIDFIAPKSYMSELTEHEPYMLTAISFTKFGVEELTQCDTYYHTETDRVTTECIYEVSSRKNQPELTQLTSSFQEFMKANVEGFETQLLEHQIAELEATLLKKNSLLSDYMNIQELLIRIPLESRTPEQFQNLIGVAASIERLHNEVQQLSAELENLRRELGRLNYIARTNS